MTAVDTRWFRTVMGHVPTAVTVITGLDDADNPVGFACGSFFSVSLDPLLVGFCVARTSTSWPRMVADTGFCVNVLADDQADASSRFAHSGGDKFGGVPWSRGRSGLPCLDRAVGWIDCTTAAIHDAGDHLIVLGSVSGIRLNSRSSQPLIFHRGGYAGVADLASTRRHAS